MSLAAPSDFFKSFEADQATVLGWFTATPSGNGASIVQDAFETARAVISKEFPPEHVAKILPQTGSLSMRDLQASLQDAQIRYQSKQTSKAFVNLQRFAKRVSYYREVLDVMVQHHPEYVALVWGTFRFLFEGVVNHEEQVSKLAQACSSIGDALPRAELSLLLYATPAMQNAVARVYAGILRFIIRAVQWYKQPSWKHAISSVTKPWKLKFQPDVDEIQEHARAVDSLANSASRAEQRQMHTTLLQLQLQTAQWMTQNQALQTSMSGDIGLSKQIICRAQVDQLLSLPLVQDLPSSGKSLQYCRRLRSRRRGNTLPERTLQDLAALKRWNQNTRASFLVTQHAEAPEVKDLPVDMIELLRGHQLPVLWALRWPEWHTTAWTTTDLIRMLFVQALQLNTAILTTGVNPISGVHMNQASGEADWLALLQQALRGIPVVYVVFDSDLVDRVFERDKRAATALMTRIATMLGIGTVKFVVSSRVFDVRFAREDLGSGSIVAMRGVQHRSLMQRQMRAQNRRRRRG